MRNVRLVVAVLMGLLFAAACSDAPTAPAGIAVEPAGPSSALMLDPVIVVGKCDPIMSIDWCGGSDPGGGDCMTSADTNLQYTSGCYSGGGGGGSGSGTPGAGGTPGTGGTTPGVTPYQEGPFLWAACVLAVVGGGVAVDDVADKFVAWYDAHKDVVEARRVLDVTLAMQRNGYEFDPATVELLYYKLDQAIELRDDAVGDVEEATGVSVITLLGAGLACGAAAAAPTP